MEQKFGSAQKNRQASGSMGKTGHSLITFGLRGQGLLKLKTAILWGWLRLPTTTVKWI